MNFFGKDGALSASSGGIGGFLAGVGYAIAVQEYSVLGLGMFGLLVGTLIGVFLIIRHGSDLPNLQIRDWVRPFLFFGLIVTVPFTCSLAMASLFGLVGISEYQPVSDFILGTILIFFSGGAAGLRPSRLIHWQK